MIRALRHAGAVVNESCGMHVHVDASRHTPRSLRNALSIMYSKEDIDEKSILRAVLNTDHELSVFEKRQPHGKKDRER